MVSAAVARVFKRDIDSNISSVAPLSDTPAQSIFERVLSAPYSTRVWSTEQ
jgi:hypothetical protein